MPNVKKDKLSKEEKLILKHKAIQLKNIFEKLSDIEAEKEIKSKQKKYEKSLNGKI